VDYATAVARLRAGSNTTQATLMTANIEGLARTRSDALTSAVG
jgi:hypothetical protein